MCFGSFEELGERCVLDETHLRSAAVAAVTAPEVVREEGTRNQNIQYLTLSLVSAAYTHLSGHRGNSKNVFNRSAGWPAVSSPAVNKFLTESRASYLC